MTKTLPKSGAGLAPPWRLNQLLALGGVTESTFRQMRRLGAVDAPLSRTRGARYERRHLVHIRDVLTLSASEQVSRTTACKLIALQRQSAQNKPKPTARSREAAALCLSGEVSCLTEGVYVVYDKSIPPPERQRAEAAVRRLRLELARLGVIRLRTVYRAK